MREAKTPSPAHKNMQCGMATLGSSTHPKEDSVPRIDSAIELVNLPRIEASLVRGEDTPITTSAPAPTQLDPRQQKDAQLHNIQRKLTDLASRWEDADLSVRRMMSQHMGISPQALIIVEESLDQAILATSNLMNKALQSTLDSITTSSETPMHDKSPSTQDIQSKLHRTVEADKTATAKGQPQKRQPPAHPDEEKHHDLSKTSSRAPKPTASTSTSPAVIHFLDLQQRKPRPVIPPGSNTLAALWHKSPMPPPDSYKGHLRNLKQRLARRSATRTGLDLPHAPNGGLIPHSRYCYEYYDPYDGFQCEVDDRWIKVELLECMRWIGNLVMDFKAEKKGKGTKVGWLGEKDEWMFLEVMGEEGVMERMVGEVD